MASSNSSAVAMYFLALCIPGCPSKMEHPVTEDLARFLVVGDEKEEVEEVEEVEEEDVEEEEVTSELLPPPSNSLCVANATLPFTARSAWSATFVWKPIETSRAKFRSLSWVMISDSSSVSDNKSITLLDPCDESSTSMTSMGASGEPTGS